ncbi:type II toxin-antitoxin system HipA family toxin [Rhodoferax sp.]|uniref:type II toxin-antitoxin system HipA family toxin n=1 Tax=Rhodoferax sp. TaxID=50421 RepID=UPI0027458875|nr:type II toxin-antitoxin system HipA family toxin [Rhodoferax sp.]
MATSYKPVTALEVRIWGQTVGAVALEPSRGYYAFEYDKRFVAKGIELAPLRMPLKEAAKPFIFGFLPEATYKRLPAMLADALPDDFGNALIDAWMASKGLQQKEITTLDRLAYMGKRGMGALELRPSRGANTESATAIQMSKLVKAARMAVEGEIDNDAHAKAVLSQIIQVGTSAGGARAKATVAWNPQTDELRSGQFDVALGFEHWLLKFDGVGPDKDLGESKDYGRIEFAYYLMASAAGIDMSPCRLLEENGRAHFMTKRFDRDGNTKHHMQSLCAMAHLDYKQKATHSYDQFFNTITELGMGPNALREALRRMVFNVMAGNLDDHTKNFAFLMRQGAPWALAPAYDITHAFNPGSEWVYQHLMSVDSKFINITRADVQAVAERHGLRLQVGPIVDQVQDALDRWPEFAAEAGVAAHEVASIAQDIARFSTGLQKPGR